MKTIICLALLLQGCNTVPIKINPPPASTPPTPPALPGPCWNCEQVKHNVHISRHSVYIGISKGW